MLFPSIYHVNLLTVHLFCMWSCHSTSKKPLEPFFYSKNSFSCQISPVSHQVFLQIMDNKQLKHLASALQWDVTVFLCLPWSYSSKTRLTAVHWVPPFRFANEYWTPSLLIDRSPIVVWQAWRRIVARYRGKSIIIYAQTSPLHIYLISRSYLHTNARTRTYTHTHTAYLRSDILSHQPSAQHLAWLDVFRPLAYERAVVRRASSVTSLRRKLANVVCQSTAQRRCILRWET